MEDVFQFVSHHDNSTTHTHTHWTIEYNFVGNDVCYYAGQRSMLDCVLVVDRRDPKLFSFFFSPARGEGQVEWKSRRMASGNERALTYKQQKENGSATTTTKPKQYCEILADCHEFFKSRSRPLLDDVSQKFQMISAQLFSTTRTFFFVHKVQEIEICRLRNLSPTCGHARKVLLGLRIKKNFFFLSADVRNAPRGLHWLPSPRFLFRMFYPRHQQNIYSPLLYNYTLSDSLQFDTGGGVVL